MTGEVVWWGMDLPNAPDELSGTDEEPPAFEAWTSPDDLLAGGPTRERILDVVLQVREPTKVSTIADRADCDPETARDYLEWFTDMGIVRERPGRPVRYERNESYLTWRRVEQIRQQYSESEIVERLTETVAAIEAYRDRFDVESPGDVSLVAASHETPIEDVWEAVATWQTLEQRAALLDAARRDEPSSSQSGRLNA